MQTELNFKFLCLHKKIYTLQKNRRRAPVFAVSGVSGLLLAPETHDVAVKKVYALFTGESDLVNYQL